jgi:hypothetical protein
MRLDLANQPYVLEVNCNPCLDEGMGLARSAEKAGISYPQLLQMIVRAALEPIPHDLDIPMLPPTGKKHEAVTTPHAQPNSLSTPNGTV